MKKYSATIICLACALALVLAGCYGNTPTTAQPVAPGQAAEQTGADPAPSTGTTYSLDDIAAHNDRNNCWTAIDGAVYDVTAFIPSHPGGAAIVQACGRDASALFGTKHGDQPRAELAKYLIGQLQ